MMSISAKGMFHVTFIFAQAMHETGFKKILLNVLNFMHYEVLFKGQKLCFRALSNFSQLLTPKRASNLGNPSLS